LKLRELPGVQAFRFDDTVEIFCVDDFATRVRIHLYVSLARILVLKQALKAAQSKYLRDVLADSLGFAGAKMTRHVVGIAHVADLESITDQDVKAQCERAALKCGRRLIMEAFKLSIQDVKNVAESLRAFA